MTIREFFESKEKLAIHCDTEEKAIELLKAFDGAGKTWANGDRYTDETCWYDYTKDTCYDNRGLYCDREWLQRTGFRIIEFEEIDLTSDLPQYPTISLDTPFTTDKLVKLEPNEMECFCVSCKKITLTSKDLDLEIDIPMEKVEQFNKLVINGIEFERKGEEE